MVVAMGLEAHILSVGKKKMYHKYWHDKASPIILSHV
jgi:hypothetical protein